MGAVLCVGLLDGRKAPLERFDLGEHGGVLGKHGSDGPGLHGRGRESELRGRESGGGVRCLCLRERPLAPAPTFTSPATAFAGAFAASLASRRRDQPGLLFGRCLGAEACGHGGPVEVLG